MAKHPHYGFQSPATFFSYLIVLALSVYGFFSTDTLYSYTFLIPVAFATVMILTLLVQSTPQYRKKLMNHILSIADLKRSHLVLDVGTGRGFLAIELAKKARKVHAVDRWLWRDLLFNSPGIVRENAEDEGVLGKIELERANPDNLPFKKNMFDIVVCTYAILNIPHGRRRKAFMEMVRVLKPKGKIIVADVMDFTRGSKRAFEYALKNHGITGIKVERVGISTVMSGIKK